jgi:NTE family protein
VKVGVALGGGSARGYAHIGALAALERHGLGPQVIVGTSFGALVGALYASGRTPSEMRVLACSLRRRDLLSKVVDFGFHKAALFEGSRLERYLESLLGVTNFEELTREFAVVTTDLDSGERVLLREGSLARALRASMTLPGLFAPVVVGGRRLIDGGLGAPVPLATLEAFELDLAIGIAAGVTADCSAPVRTARRALQTPLGRRVHHGLHGAGGRHPLSSLGRAVSLALNTYSVTVSEEAEDAQVHTRPPIGWLHFHRAAVAIAAGDEALEAAIPHLRQQVLRRQEPEAKD